MQRYRTALILAACAAISFAALLAVSHSTIVPLAARGTGPNGVSVTIPGWVSLFLSMLATGGFSLSSVVSAIVAMIPRDAADAAKQTAPPIKKIRVAQWDSADLGTYETLLANATDDEKPLISAIAWKHAENQLRAKFGDRPAIIQEATR
jgi:hypothetical protein